MSHLCSRNKPVVVVGCRKISGIYHLQLVRTFFLFMLLLVGSTVIHPEGARADKMPKKIILTTTLAHRVVAGKPIPLRIRVTPAPSRQKPVHLHIYIDQKMVQMLTLTRLVSNVKLPPLNAGKHSVTFIEANPLTHQPMEGDSRMTGMNGMDMGMAGSGKDMGTMDDNLSSIPARFRLKTLILLVEPR